VTDRLVVSEIFGPTWQGEGPLAGRRAGFVRLGRCNLTCSYCDTPYTWDWARFDPAAELSDRTTDEILETLDAMAIDMVVVTGGEPLLQQHHLVPLLEAIRSRGWRVEIETNGTLAPNFDAELVDQWNVSPKLANAGVERQHCYRPDVLRAFEATGRAVFKFVAVGLADLEEIAEIVDENGLGAVWVMPEGTDAATVTTRLQALAPAVLARGWNLTPRLHILIWGNRRGV
jgi:7-carboxy-7-deazaguanine synthase